jgi:hypothetical protein
MRFYWPYFNKLEELKGYPNYSPATKNLSHLPYGVNSKRKAVNFKKTKTHA